MKIKEFLEMQKKLDSIIFEKANIKIHPTIKIRLALLVELGELANEMQNFKYWKHNKNIDRLKVLEEWADCFHFALSLETKLQKMKVSMLDGEFKKICDIAKGSQENYKKARLPLFFSEERFFIFIFNSISNLEDYKSEIFYIIDLGIFLDFTAEEMEEAYLKKYQKNLDRQKNNY